MWHYTALGKKFYRERRVEWLVELPVDIQGRRRDNQGTYDKKSWLPVTYLNIPNLYTPAMLSDARSSSRWS